MAFDPLTACQSPKSWRAQPENEGRSKGWIFRKNGRYLVAYEAKRDAVISVDDISASGYQ